MQARMPTLRLAWLALLVLLAAGLAVRVHFAAPDPYPSVDGTFYLTQSRDLFLHNRLPYSSFSPGWPLLVSLPLALVGAQDPAVVFRVAQALNVALGTFWLLLAFFFWRPRLGAGPALGAVAMLAALPAAVIASKGDLTEPSYGCLLLLVVLLLPRDRFLAGLALGAAYLVRPEALLFAGALCLVLYRREKTWPWGLLSAVALCVGPYAVFTRVVTGSWAASGKMGFLTGALQRHDGLAYGELVGNNLLSLASLLAGLVGWPLLAAALVRLVVRPRLVHLALLALLPLPFFDFAMVARYWLPYLPFLLLAAGDALGFGWAVLTRRRPSRSDRTTTRRWFSGFWSETPDRSV